MLTINKIIDKKWVEKTQDREYFKEKIIEGLYTVNVQPQTKFTFGLFRELSITVLMYFTFLI